MSVTITLNAQSIGELRAQMIELLNDAPQPKAPVIKPSEEDNIAQQVAEANFEAAASPSPEPEKKERKPRAKKVEAAPVVVAETPAEIKFQDEEDEAAEVEPVKVETLTRNDVRIAFSQYVQNYGAVAVEEDIKELLKRIYPAGDVLSLSKIPESHDDFAKVIAGAKEMLEKNPFKREKVSA